MEDPIDDDSLLWIISCGFLLIVLLLALGCYIRIKTEHIKVKSNRERIEERLKQINETNARDGHIQRRNSMKNTD